MPFAPSIIADFDADAIAGCALWCRADRRVENYSSVFPSDGDNVAEWFNLVGGVSIASEYEANAPSYDASNPKFNGHPTIRFNSASNEYMRYSDNLDQPVYYFVVCAWDSPSAAFQFVIDGDDINNRHTFYSAITTGRLTAYAGLNSGAAGTLLDSNAHYITTYFNGVNSEVFLDGVSAIDMDLGSQDVLGLVIGASYEPSLYLNGDIAEILIYQADLSVAERQGIEAYLANRYQV